MSNPLQILIIDDDRGDRLLLRKALAASGVLYDITEAKNGSEGLQAASHLSFDAILLDYRLPDRSGLEILNKIRKDQLCPTAVIVLSQTEDDAISEKSIEMGAQDFMLKSDVSAGRLSRAIKLARQRFCIEDELRVSREQLREVSERDSLTGLANRRGCEGALENTLARAKRGDNRFAVLLLDLDDFKTINDSMGHDIGDQILVRIALRIKSVVREGDLVCRLGGDEFVVLMRDLEENAQAAFLAERIVEVLRHPITLRYSEHVVTASIGVAVYDEHTETVSDLLKSADMAMYQAKQEGRNKSRFFSDELQRAVILRARLKRDMFHAFTSKQFELFYQPQFDVANRCLGGIEALLRWRHPELGLLSPVQFLPVAEETGFINELGQWVIEQASRQLLAWKTKYEHCSAKVTISANLSAVQLRQDTLLAMTLNSISLARLDLSMIELEITESALITYTPEMMSNLMALSQAGVTFSLDDFGTGYSSIEHLKVFPIKVLKIDKQFIHLIGTGDKEERLLIALIQFAKALQLKVVAEGVETEEQARFCDTYQCDLLQGFYFSKPLPVHEFENTVLEKPTWGC